MPATIPALTVIPLLAATLACLMTGAVAGLFFHKSGAHLLKLAPLTPSSQSVSSFRD